MKHKTSPFERELRATQFALENLCKLYCALMRRMDRVERIITLRSEGE